MTKPLPKMQADKQILELFKQVGEKEIGVKDGMETLSAKLADIAGDCRSMNKLVVMAVLMAEDLNPNSKGVFLTEENLIDMWNNPKDVDEPYPTLRMGLTLTSCLQFTSMGVQREGAKAIALAFDELLPEESEYDRS